MAKIGVILSGCGVFDGTEIHEAVLTLLSIEQAGATYQCLAPDRSLQVVDHLKKAPSGETRNVLVESARIARGDVKDLARVKGADFDAIVLPGGFGAAKNLCTFASEGAGCSVDPEVARVLGEAHAARRPIGFICIAPAVAARVFGATLHPVLTIGHDKGTAEAIEKMQARHQACDVKDLVVDEKNRILSTPAYMEGRSVVEVYTGIHKLVKKLVEMTR
jgi:enhancing lycopene biosynthesis protein 2